MVFCHKICTPLLAHVQKGSAPLINSNIGKNVEQTKTSYRSYKAYKLAYKMYGLNT
jgi:hypothetical protein